MAEIALTQEQVTTIDDADLEAVRKHKWAAQRASTGKYYAVTSIKDKNGVFKRVYLHRFLMNPPRGLVVDHKDGNPLNNCRSNLRICTQSQNITAAYNTGNGKGEKKSKYRGVSYIVNGKRQWKATTRNNNKTLYLGVFASEVEAAKARDKAVIELHGEFAVLNFPTETGNN